MTTTFFQTAERLASNGKFLDFASIEQQSNGLYNVIYAHAHKERKFSTAKGAQRFQESTATNLKGC